MSPSKPPALATWLFEHLPIGENKDALGGDLLEQFNRGRSSHWYWRQVLVAVLLGGWKEWRILWIAAGATTLWIWALVVWWARFQLSPWFGALVGWSIKNPWPLSTIYLIAINAAIDITPLLVALSVCAGITKRFNLRKFAFGLSAGSFVLEACKWGIVAGLLLSHVGGAGTPNLVKYVIWGLPCFVALLLSLRIVGPRGKNGETATLLV
jgi:hypothetical protein